MSVGVKCECKKFTDNIDKVNMNIIITAMNNGDDGYDGDQFEYCPWCAKKLVEFKEK